MSFDDNFYNFVCKIHFLQDLAIKKTTNVVSFFMVGVSGRTSNSTSNILEFRKRLSLPENVIFINNLKQLINI